MSIDPVESAVPGGGGGRNARCHPDALALSSVIREPVEDSPEGELSCVTTRGSSDRGLACRPVLFTLLRLLRRPRSEDPLVVTHNSSPSVESSTVSRINEDSARAAGYDSALRP